MKHSRVCFEEIPKPDRSPVIDSVSAAAGVVPVRAIGHRPQRQIFAALGLSWIDPFIS